jgi:hypothetical protein
LFLALYIAIADVGEAELAVAFLALAEDFGHCAAYGSETYEGNSARGGTISGRGGRDCRTIWRSLWQGCSLKRRLSFIIRLEQVVEGSEPNARALCRKERGTSHGRIDPSLRKTIARNDMEWVQAAYRAEAASKLVI